jgi:hypothetical protein
MKNARSREDVASFLRIGLPSIAFGTTSGLSSPLELGDLLRKAGAGFADVDQIFAFRPYEIQRADGAG